LNADRLGDFAEPIPAIRPSYSRLFTVFAGKTKSRRADSNRLPLLITSDHSGVAGGCTGLQIPHI
jgi:hypothetical protein